VCVYSAVSGERACAIFTFDWQWQSETGVTINLCRDHILCSNSDLRSLSMISSSTMILIWNTVCDDSIFFRACSKCFIRFSLYTHTTMSGVTTSRMSVQQFAGLPDFIKISLISTVICVYFVFHTMYYSLYYSTREQIYFDFAGDSRKVLPPKYFRPPHSRHSSVAGTGVAPHSVRSREGVKRRGPSSSTRDQRGYF